MVATAVTTAESAAAEAPCHSAARETPVETRRGLESALRGCEAARRSSLKRSATEASVC